MSHAGIVAIVGGGVSGLSTAILLAEAGWRTRIISPLAPLLTTSSKAAAFWYPLHVKGYQPIWARRSYEYFLALENEPRAEVRRISSREFFRRPGQMERWITHCDWRDIPAVALRELRDSELPRGFARGVGFSVPVIYMPAYLPYLEHRYLAGGGVFERHGISSLQEVLDGSDIIVNCTGLGARELAHDRAVYPCQGQVVSVAPLDFEELILVSAENHAQGDAESDETLYIVPRHGHDIVLGGTSVDDATGLTPDENITRRIIERCAALFPIFQSAKVIEARVGLRPSRRGGVRTELDAELTCQYGKPLIHNYGHGGAGVSLSWGCADEVVRIARSV